jgi:glutathione S-transferase
MFRLYDFLPSGNGYKIRLLLTQLGISFEQVEVDILKGESRTPEFLTKNPNGRIPIKLKKSRTTPAGRGVILQHGGPVLAMAGRQ